MMRLRSLCEVRRCIVRSSPLGEREIYEGLIVAGLLNIRNNYVLINCPLEISV